VLSGFCLALPVVRGDGFVRGGAVQFFQKRARRILPPYFLALVFSLLLIRLAIGRKTGMHWDNSLPVTEKAVITHLLLIQDLFRDTSAKINHAFGPSR
jgi:peptidoglycan/LPS O-acetylase OafA/YrhL